MTLTAAASNTRALWYLTRGTGLVALVLLTAGLLLGLLELSQWARPGWPRFLTAGLHKNISLLVTVFLGLHIVTAVLDSFAPIGWLDAVVPFISTYRPIWLGLGALAFDLLIAISVTSLLRTRLGYRAWRAVHWFSYACWPVALVHGLGTGSDIRTWWVLVVSLACLGLVLAAVWWRISKGWPADLAIRTAALFASVAAPIVLVAWLVTGPLGPGWASRAGTPSTLLASADAAGPPGPGVLRPRFAAAFSGTAVHGADGNPHDATLTIDATLTSGTAGQLHVVLQGPAASGGSITLRPASEPALYQGRVTSLGGGDLSAGVLDSTGHQLRLAIHWQINGSRVSGSLQAS